MRALAQWLGVSTQWLRFGENERSDAACRTDAGPRFEPNDVKLIVDLQRLEQQYQVLAREFIRMLVRIDYANKR